jgi:hypothetical protein
MTGQLPGKYVLVVDDDLTHGALAMTLEAARYAIRQAADGREALLRPRSPPGRGLSTSGPGSHHSQGPHALSRSLFTASVLVT